MPKSHFWWPLDSPGWPNTRAVGVSVLINTKLTQLFECSNISVHWQGTFMAFSKSCAVNTYKSYWLSISALMKGSIRPPFNFSAYFPWCYPPVSFSCTWVQLARAQPATPLHVLNCHFWNIREVCEHCPVCAFLYFVICNCWTKALSSVSACSVLSFSSTNTALVISSKQGHELVNTWVNDPPLLGVIPTEPQILMLQPAAAGNQRRFRLRPGKRLAAITSSMFLDEFLNQSFTELSDLLKVFSLSVSAVTLCAELQPIRDCARQHLRW